MLLLTLVIGGIFATMAQLPNVMPTVTLPDSSEIITVALTSTTIAAPVPTPIETNLLVYNTNTTADVVAGYYYWTGILWKKVPPALLGIE